MTSLRKKTLRKRQPNPRVRLASHRLRLVKTTRLKYKRLSNQFLMSQRSRKRRTTSPVKKVRPTLSPARKQQCSSKTRRMLTRQSVNSNKKSKAAKLLVGKLSKTNLRIKQPIPLLLLPLAEDLLEPNPKALLKTHPKATLSSVVKSQHSLNRQREVKKRKSWKTSQNLVKPPPQFKLKIRYLNKLRVK